MSKKISLQDLINSERPEDLFNYNLHEKVKIQNEEHEYTIIGYGLARGKYKLVRKNDLIKYRSLDNGVTHLFSPDTIPKFKLGERVIFKLYGTTEIIETGFIIEKEIDSDFYRVITSEGFYHKRLEFELKKVPNKDRNGHYPKEYILDTEDKVDTISMDNVNSPNHYQVFPKFGIEAIHIAQKNLTAEEFLGALKFNVLKYVHRADKKNGLEDWKKIHKYSGWVIEFLDTGTITVNDKFKIESEEEE